ncbi:MAG TPA: thaumatin family protein, partial [Thermoanaerobaculia bacterium]|nr:thaumatin family protein [Thermoanaerobaculia bacterium]
MRTRTRLLIGLAAAVVAALGGVVAPAALAVTDHTVTFVNGTGETVWIGSTVNADGSVNFTGLPTLAPGESATVVVAESADPGHWRGKFFARQGCTGADGADFHCAVGDCGTHVDRCDTGEQPVSLAEFN